MKRGKALEVNKQQATWRYAHILPNGVTVLSLTFGMTAMTYAATQLFASAIACILIAALLDACDGRIARRTNTASKFGAELDSLADVICFGAAPSFILYQWAFAGGNSLIWIVCMLPAIAAALRLARFNVMSDDVKKPSWASLYFTGVPAPAGAFLVLVPIYAVNAGVLDQSQAVTSSLIWAPLVAALMVSTLPTFSGKQTQRKARTVLFLPFMLMAAAAILGLLMWPWATLLAFALIYVCSFAVSWSSQRRKQMTLD